MNYTRLKHLLFTLCLKNKFLQKLFRGPLLFIILFCQTMSSVAEERFEFECLTNGAGDSSALVKPLSPRSINDEVVVPYSIDVSNLSEDQKKIFEDRLINYTHESVARFNFEVSLDATAFEFNEIGINFVRPGTPLQSLLRLEFLPLSEAQKTNAIIFEFFNPENDNSEFCIGQSSQVGRATRNPQFIRFATGCFRGSDPLLSLGIHELGHAFNLIHEQQRLGRDDYVHILWDNIRVGFESNYKVRRDHVVYGPYDFSSIMHYRVTTFIRQDLIPFEVCDENNECFLSPLKTFLVTPQFEGRIRPIPPLFNVLSNIGLSPELSAYDRLNILVNYIEFDSIDELVEVPEGWIFPGYDFNFDLGDPDFLNVDKFDFSDYPEPANQAGGGGSFGFFSDLIGLFKNLLSQN